MWPSDDQTVACIACGERVSREAAREYDKYGDRWDRDGKSFEYLCKSCFADTVKAPRTGLEELLVDIQVDVPDRGTFLARYLAAIGADEDSGTGSGRGSGSRHGRYDPGDD